MFQEYHSKKKVQAHYNGKGYDPNHLEFAISQVWIIDEEWP